MCWARCFSVSLLISFSQQSQGVMGKESERSTNLARGTQLVNRRGVTGCPHHVCLKKNLMVFINFKNEDIVDLQCYINLYYKAMWLSYTHIYILVAQLVNNPPAMQETWVRSLGCEDPPEKGKATHSIIEAWRIPWTIPLGCKESDMTEWLSLSLHLLLKYCFLLWSITGFWI